MADDADYSWKALHGDDAASAALRRRCCGDALAVLRLPPDLRREVLSYLCTVSRDHGIRRALHSEPKDGFGQVVRVDTFVPITFVNGEDPGRCPAHCPPKGPLLSMASSAAASIDTLVTHSATMRAVCQVFRQDIGALRAAPDSLATAKAWLEHLYCCTSSGDVWGELEVLALAGRRANLTRSLFKQSAALRPEEGRESRRRELAVRCPRAWSETRQQAVRGLLQNSNFPAPTGNRVFAFTSAPAFAHARVLTVEEASTRQPPVDRDALATLANASLDSVVRALRGARLPLVVTSVTLRFMGGQITSLPADMVSDAEGALAAYRANPRASFAALEAELSDVFGMADASLWTKAWTNGNSRFPLEDFATAKRLYGSRAVMDDGLHDAGRPPLSSLRECFAAEREGICSGEVELTRASQHVHEMWPGVFDMKCIDVVDVDLPDDASARPQRMGDTGYSQYCFVDTSSAKCRRGHGRFKPQALKLNSDVVDWAGDRPPLSDALMLASFLDGIFLAMCSCKLPGLD